VPPSCLGEMEILLPKGARQGDKVVLRVSDGEGELINIVPITLGHVELPKLPESKSGIPKWEDDGKTLHIKGKGYSLALDRATGDFAVSDPSHSVPLLHFPALHLTRYDFGDLAGPKSPPYALFPDRKTHKIEDVTVKEVEGALEVKIKDSYDGFEGSVVLRLDKDGVGKVTYDYVYSGDEMHTRELGVKVVLKPECDELSWRRWSEWGVFPEDSISRTQGTAKALRTGEKKRDADGVRPTWPWSQDQTELGTNDFRSVKFNIYECTLLDENGSGLRINGKADIHVRPALSHEGVDMHILSRCPLGEVLIKAGERLQGEHVFELLKAGE